MTIIDLSHAITDGMTTYPGLPAPRITDHLTFEESDGVYAEGTEFTIARIEMVANTGTYLDTPAHRYRDGHDLAGLPLERCVGLPARVVSTTGDAIGPADLPDEDLTGQAVLIHTGWAEHWGTDAYLDAQHPHLTEAGAQHLVDRGATLVGIDSVNIDDTVGRARPAHSLLLAAEIPVVEHLTGLGALPERGAVFSAPPPAVVGMGTFTVRAFAVVD